jgi:membrane associated rhomboid family serine protease
MIPLRDTIPAGRTAGVMRALIILHVIGFVIELRQGAALDALLYRFGVVPSDWHLASLGDVLQWPALLSTLITSQFLHGSVLHLGSNLLYLWIFGDNVEDRLGHGRFLLLYLAGGVAAGLLQVVMEPQASVPMIGASGAIAGVLGAYFVLFPFARVVTLLPVLVFWKTVEVPAFLFLGLWFVLQWFQGLSTIGQMASVGGVAWWAHVGGFACGVVFVRWLRPRRHYF